MIIVQYIRIPWMTFSFCLRFCEQTFKYTVAEFMVWCCPCKEIHSPSFSLSVALWKSERWRRYGFDPVVFDPCRVLVSHRRCRRRHRHHRSEIIRKRREARQKIIIFVITVRIMTHVVSMRFLQGYRVFIAFRDFQAAIDGLCKSNSAASYVQFTRFFFTCE